MNITVDALGKSCPLPVIEAKKAIESLTGEGIVEVLVDNEIAVQNVLKLAAHKGLAAVSEQISAASCYSVRIICGQPSVGGSLNNDSSTLCMPSYTAFHPSPIKKGTVVVISSNQMGNGDEALGKLLMKAFLFSLTRQDILPETMLFYNSGAFLTCESSENAEDLKWLEERGVEIITCGTCLDFYGCKDRLIVGTVSNMYDIVQKQMEAASLIRP